MAYSWSHLRGKTALVDDSTKAQKRFTNAKNGGNGVPDHSPSDNGSAHNRDSGSVKGKHGTVKAETGLPDSNASAVPLRQFSTPQSKPAHTDRLRLLRKPPPPAVTSDAGIDAKLDATEAFVPPSAPLVKRRHAAITTSSHKPPSRHARMPARARASARAQSCAGATPSRTACAGWARMAALSLTNFRSTPTAHADG